jgi:hypothetical protein
MPIMVFSRLFVAARAQGESREMFAADVAFATWRGEHRRIEFSGFTEEFLTIPRPSKSS